MSDVDDMWDDDEDNENVRVMMQRKREIREVYDEFVASLGHENLGSVASEILRLRAENEKLRAALKDCASDLEAEIRGRYTGGGGWDIHPSLVKKFERDMSTVRAAAAALKEMGDE